MKELFGQRLREQRLKHHLTLEQVAEKADLSANYIGMVERGLKEPGLATIVKILNALNISADELLCDLVPSASHVTDDEISKRLEGLTPMQKKVALDLLDTYITNLAFPSRKSTSVICTWLTASVRWQVPLQLTIPMWLLSSGCRNSVWNWRFVVFLPNMRKAPTSCSSKQTAALLNT